MAKKNGYMQTANISEIRDSIVFLKDGTMLAVLEISPIDFDRMPEQKKQKVAGKYKEWLESLDYPVQIVARTVNKDTEDQAKILKNKMEHMIKQKQEYRDLLNLFKEFESWFDSYLSKNTRAKRIYYLVIPFSGAEKPSVIDRFMKSRAKSRKDMSVAMLNMRAASCIAKLIETGVKAHRLSAEQIENLYDSYFTIHNQTGENENSEFIGPDRWFGMWKNVMEAKE